MRKPILAVLALLVAIGVGIVHAENYGVPANIGRVGIASGNPAGLTVCDKSAQLQMTTATTTQLVALVANQKIRVCGYQIQGSTVATATNVTLVYGTGAACVTGTTAITPAFTYPASSVGLPASYGGGAGEVFQTIASNALCATSSAAGTVNIFVTYTQF